MARKPTYQDLERKISELNMRLGDYRERFAEISRNITEFVFEHDLEGNVTELNPHYTGRLGLYREDMVGKNARSLIPKPFRKQFDDYLKRVISNGKDEGLMQVVSKDGKSHVIEYNNILVTNKDGKKMVQGVARDVTERLETEHALIESDTRFRIILDSIEDGYFEVDLAGNFTFFNSRIPEHMGYTEEEMMGMNYRRLMDTANAEYIYNVFHKIFITGESVKSIEWELIKKDGSRFIADTSVSLKRNRKGEPVGFQGIIRDVTERKRFEQELAYMAYHDPLTGLFNRKAFVEKLTETIREARRYHGRRAVLFLDLDSFKKVNDIHGHEIGDRLLTEVAARLRRAVRESDFVCRLGGDEFSIILTNSRNLNAELVAGRIVEALCMPYHIMGITIDFISTSIGISIYPEDGLDAEVLLKRADEAMYHAKERKSCFVHCSEVRDTPSPAP
ncbi:MAG: diguanylate cyclase domain-containing protein [Desulfomonilia bacterium]|uniref:Putative diguanylate cyclase YegE n=1 Tax=anaerobic digester metagenome TaxID=1263854 RepID=A0A485M3B2_9ZZZZ|nr:diguanylate cyclase [Pseudomonadota bacterium]HON39302.1 diguanylate cyclase [Deltaproteobacteria bacterium]HRS56228.1 diguanylate cyclase [Desulfomonilia bacterium]HPD21381.1 diguanylate cyclase [Deltaproteobacteria bacterium]HPX18808.1 diguanylate cyclase [Deltaproteobacteria bacterium]